LYFCGDVAKRLSIHPAFVVAQGAFPPSQGGRLLKVSCHAFLQDTFSLNAVLNA
jgi:hypothetical protein